MSSNLPDFITHFLDPAHYNHPVDKVELVQTHISYVLLAGEFVYKFKKPVDFGFLNFTTLEKRKFYCEQELALNSRLCPDIYLDVVAVFVADTGFTMAVGNGNAVEYGVKMSMMPLDRMMGKVIADGKLTRDHITSIVETLVPFYDKAIGGEDISKFGTADAVSVNVLENFDQTQNFIGKGALNDAQFQTISSYAKGFLKNDELFLGRADKVKDCHGDMYSANICLADKVYVFDCIEFNERFRYCDVASDVAFLAMDLDFHGLQDLSEFFISTFVKASNDPGLLAVLSFYKCYRAYVRGKIGLFTAYAPEVDAGTRQNSLAAAKKYFLLAEKYAK